MVHLLKYERMGAVARPLGSKLAAAMLMLEGLAATDLVVVPVPLYPAKERVRGYNQAALLGEAALAELKQTTPGWRLRLAQDVLRRGGGTGGQSALAPRRAAKDIAGGFCVGERAAG